METRKQYVLAVIPARGGSKGIVGKNLIKLAGKSLIQYTVEAAQNSQFLDDIIVTTDSHEISKAVSEMGLETGYLRPKNLSLDNSGMVETVLDCLKWYEKNKKQQVDQIVLLQPTSPLRATEDIDGAITAQISMNSNSLVSANSVREHPCECIVKSGARWQYLKQPPIGVNRRQDYSDGSLFINGAIYIVKYSFLQAKKVFIEQGVSQIYIMPPERSVDIDSYDDLKYAEYLLQKI